MSGKIKLAILGNNFGKKVHLPAFSLIPNLNISCFGRQDKFDINNFDIFSVAVPPVEAFNIIKQLLKYQKPVFCEKPLCATWKQAIELQVLSQNIINVINFEICESKIIQKCQELILNKTIGEIEKIEFKWLTKNYKNINNLWKFDVLKGGGVINNLGSHILYLIEYVLGQPIIKISGDLKPSSQFNTSSNLKLQFNKFNGEVLMDADTQIASHIYFKIYGENANLILQNNSEILKNFELLLQTDKTEVICKEDEIEQQDGRIRLTYSLAKKFIDGIKNNNKIFPNIDDGVRIRYLINQIIKES